MEYQKKRKTGVRLENPEPVQCSLIIKNWGERDE